MMRNKNKTDRGKGEKGNLKTRIKDKDGERSIGKECNADVTRGFFWQRRRIDASERSFVKTKGIFRGLFLYISFLSELQRGKKRDGRKRASSCVYPRIHVSTYPRMRHVLCLLDVHLSLTIAFSLTVVEKAAASSWTRSLYGTLSYGKFRIINERVRLC